MKSSFNKSLNNEDVDRYMARQLQMSVRLSIHSEKKKKAEVELERIMNIMLSIEDNKKMVIDSPIILINDIFVYEYEK